jgi:DNA-binding transcriptional ArsR family regulator
MESAEALATLLRALGDPSRLRLLRALEQGELTVGEMTEVTGLSQPRVSRHLRLLCEARVLRRARDRNEVYYRANVDADRRALVQQTLDSLSPGDPDLTQDHARLKSILDRRRGRAQELLTALGIEPLDDAAAEAVAAGLRELLAQTESVPCGEWPALGRLLDVGTGTGTMLPLLSPHADRIVAVDHSREMRLVARARVLANGLVNCTVQDGDMYALSFADAYFDTVTMDRVLGVASRPESAIAEAARLLRPGGRLLVVETGHSIAGGKGLETWLGDAGFSPALTRDGTSGSIIAVARRTAAARANVA